MPKKFYAVAVGKRTGIFGTWEQCKEQVHGYKGAKYKSFNTVKEAQDFVGSVGQAGGGSNKRKVSDTDSSSSASKPRLGDAKPGLQVPNPATTRKPTSSTWMPSCKSGVHISIMFDGGARGNPGVAGAGAAIVISDNQRNPPLRKTIHIRDYVGERETNNVAEYRGLLSGLKIALQEIEKINWAGSRNIELIVQGDSNLIIKQLKGEFRVKKDTLIPLFKQAMDHIQAIKKVGECTTVFEHVYREDNKLADSLANAAMDARRSWVTTSDDEHQEQTPLS